MAEELLPIFIGIFFAFIGLLITFILGMIGFYTKLLDIIKSLTKIEAHAGRISGLEDKMIELRFAFEKGKLSSVPLELPKSKVELVVKVKNRTEKTTEIEITAKEPIPATVAKASIGKMLRKWAIARTAHSTYQISFLLSYTDAIAAARAIKDLLNILDKEWFKEKHWEDIFKDEMTKSKE